MPLPSSGKDVECRCIPCQYNNNGDCGYQGRILIDSNGECAVMERGYGQDRGPYG